MSGLLWLHFLALPGSLIGSEPAVDQPIDFAAQIRPLLSDRCFTCHGPDSAQRATDLRLDDEDSVHQWAVVAGDAEASELIRRIESDDPDQVMPPPGSHLSLSPQERQLLRRWVAAGARFARHWSFVSLRPIEPPELPADSSWAFSRNPIDSFVLDKLRQRQLAPSPEADRATLARRLTLDLIGLVPSEQELDAFETASEGDAYDRLVDRLLDSPHFGEKWATDWLDVARYADTYGYQADVYRATWPWRDWVVAALNQNLPYDQFITWQLAGDLLPQPAREPLVATAFNRHHRQTNEGGSVEEEFRAEYVADRVNTFGAAFLGLTLECARCHDHKYDPISQREYYQLAAFFNNIDESGLYSHFTSAVPTPALPLFTDQQAAALAELAQRIEHREQVLDRFKRCQQTAIDADADSLDDSPTPVESTGQAHGVLAEVLQRMGQHQLGHYRFESLDGGKLLNEITGETSGKVTDDPLPTEGVDGQGLLLSGDNSVVVPEGGGWTRNQPFTLSLWLNLPGHFDRCVVLHRSRAWTDAGSRGYELLIEDGRLSAALIHFWPGNAVRVRTTDPLPLDRWGQVTWTYDGSSSAAGIRLYLDGRPMATEIVRDQLTQAIHGGEANELTIGQRFRDVGFKHGRIDQLRIFAAELSELECQVLYWQDAQPELLEQQIAGLPAEVVAEFQRLGTPEHVALVAELFELRQARSQLVESVPELMVMREMAGQRPTYILRRGEYDAPVEEVQRGLPHNLLPVGDAERSETIAADPPALLDRLDLARWLTDPRHPLTARVAVNRVWQSLFGRGLVETSEDFGMQGSPPTHPELLDWLALRFIDSGWDYKGLIRLIVHSSTYRQTSDLKPRLLAEDPENRWLARGPAVRLTAEQLRDAALAASDLLVRDLGGPPVKPYQPEGLWEEKSGASYQRDVGPGSRRRSLYTFWKRTSPPPMMMTFDASNREVCQVRRQVTMTPLQQLVLLNDPQFVEAARGLAERACLERSTLVEQLDSVFRRLTSQRTTAEQTQVLLGLYEQQHQYFSDHPEAVDQFLEVGDHRPDPAVDRTALAALTVVAGGLMSYDGFVMKR